MQKQLLIIVLILISAVGFSQTVQTQGSPNRATHYLGGLQADSTLVVPVRNRDSIYPNLPYKGRVQLNETTNKLEYHNGEEWVETGSDGVTDSGIAEKMEKEIDGFTAQVTFPDTATSNSYWVFPQAESNEENPKYVPVYINGAVAGSDGSVYVDLPGVISNTLSKIAPADRLNFYVPSYWMDSFPNIITYSTTLDEQNFTDVGGVRNDGRTYGPAAIAEDDYVTKSQLDQITGTGTSPIVAIDEGNGEGYVIANRNPDNYGAVGLRATDLSSNSTTDLRGATGDYSFAAGSHTTTGGDYSFAAGSSTEANGSASTALGQSSIANGFGSLSIGYNNIAITESAENGPIDGSPLFIVGNGNDTSTRSNAYALFNNGNSTQYGVASYGGDYSSSYNERSLVDKEYVDNLALEGVTMLKNSASQYSGIVKLSDMITNNFIWEFPQTDGNLESPTYVIKSISGQQANSYGEVEIGLQSTINYTYSSSIAPVAVNDRLHFYNTPSEALYNFTTFYNYVPNQSIFEPVSGVKFDGRAYGPFAVDNEDYTPFSQVESMIDSAKSQALELNEDNSAMIFDLGGGSKTSIEALAPNTGVNAILQFPSPSSDGAYRIVTNINGYNADNSGQINIDANGIFNSGATAVVQDVIDLRSDDGLIFTHSASGNKLEVNGDGIEYNDTLLVDKTTLVNYVASATNISYNAPKSATDLNNAYPGVNEGFIVKCPNAGGIYLKTAVAGQWQFIAATTLNP